MKKVGEIPRSEDLKEMRTKITMDFGDQKITPTIQTEYQRLRHKGNTIIIYQ